MPRLPVLVRTLDGYCKGCSYFQKAVRAFHGQREDEYEASLLSAAKDGIGALELILKIYLKHSCRHKMTADEERTIDGYGIFTELKALMRYADPPLDQRINNQLKEYYEIRNRAIHHAVVPSRQELCQALEDIRHYAK